MTLIRKRASDSIRGKTERGFDFLGYHFEPEEISPA
jgi:hypothetical protein